MQSPQSGVRSPPELAVEAAVAEGWRLAAEGAGAFDDRLQRGALPHEAAGFEVLPAAWQMQRNAEMRRRSLQTLTHSHQTREKSASPTAQTVSGSSSTQDFIFSSCSSQ